MRLILIQKLRINPSLRRKKVSNYPFKNKPVNILYKIIARAVQSANCILLHAFLRTAAAPSCSST